MTIITPRPRPIRLNVTLASAHISGSPPQAPDVLMDLNCTINKFQRADNHLSISCGRGCCVTFITGTLCLCSCVVVVVFFI